MLPDHVHGDDNHRADRLDKAADLSSMPISRSGYATLIYFDDAARRIKAVPFGAPVPRPGIGRSHGVVSHEVLIQVVREAGPAVDDPRSAPAWQLIPLSHKTSAPVRRQRI